MPVGSRPQRARLYRGDALRLLPRLDSDSVDALITDPPYSSGGFTRGDRTADPITKYQQHGGHVHRPSFAGDNRDARSWSYWCTLWLSECMRVVRPGGYALVFTDWRQLPSLTDALQAAGWIWRGLIAWDKGRGARAPHKGYFRHQCEYLVWGSRGKLPIATHDGPYDGCYRRPVELAKKQHLTGKPLGLMRDLVRIIPAGGTILDPFCGSGTTGLAALELGRRFVGIEQDAHYHQLAGRRLATARAIPITT